MLDWTLRTAAALGLLALLGRTAAPLDAAVAAVVLALVAALAAAVLVRSGSSRRPPA